MPPECLARVHAPIGLDIGAVTPAEIAISIMAELVAVRRGVDTGLARHEAARRRRLDSSRAVAAAAQRHHPHHGRRADRRRRQRLGARRPDCRRRPGRRGGPRHRHRRARRLRAPRLHPDARPSVPDAVPRLRRRHAAARVAEDARLADGGRAHAIDAARLGAPRRRRTAAHRHHVGADDGDGARHRRRLRNAGGGRAPGDRRQVHDGLGRRRAAPPAGGDPGLDRREPRA